MSEIDLTKPLQFETDGKQWIDVTWHRVMPGGALVFEYGDSEWSSISRTDVKYARFRNKPEPRVRPYTFEEAKRFVGTPVINKLCPIVVMLISRLECNESTGDVLYTLAGGGGQPLGHTMLRTYTHIDGTPFGVVENE